MSTQTIKTDPEKNETDYLDYPDTDYDYDNDDLQDDLITITNIRNGEGQASKDELEQLARAEDELRQLVDETTVHTERIADNEIKGDKVHGNALESTKGETYDKMGSGIKDNLEIKKHGAFPSSHQHKQKDRHRNDTKTVEDLKQNSHHTKSKSVEFDEIVKILNDTLSTELNNHKHKTVEKTHEESAKSKKKPFKFSYLMKNKPMAYDDITRLLDSSNPGSKSRFVSKSKYKKFRSRTYFNLGAEKASSDQEQPSLYDYEQHVKSNDDVFLLGSDLASGKFSNSSVTIEENLSPWDVRCNTTDLMLWVGIGVGVGACLTFAALMTCGVTFLRKRRGCNGCRRFANGRFSLCFKEEEPIYIKLSQLHGTRKTSGCNYIVTVLDESNFSVDSSCSSEDELLGMPLIKTGSAEKKWEKRLILANTKTSTPIKRSLFET